MAVTAVTSINVQEIIGGTSEFVAAPAHPSSRTGDFAQAASCSIRAAARASDSSSKRYGVAFGME